MNNMLFKWKYRTEIDVANRVISAWRRTHRANLAGIAIAQAFAFVELRFLTIRPMPDWW